jgi:DNA-binding XRE family transcriptional regulator
VKYLGRVIGKSDKSYYKREAGKVKFSLSEAKKISEVVGIPVDDLFFEYELSKLERTAV